jgi:CspA family cold shock protein
MKNRPRPVPDRAALVFWGRRPILLGVALGVQPEFCPIGANQGAVATFPVPSGPAGRQTTQHGTKTRTRKDRPMPTGTVKWFNTTKGFGFIAPDDGGKDVFVHISAVEQAGMTGLPDNTKISYELREGRDGRSSAVELKKIG